MDNRRELLIVVDAGHGGWDNGASYDGRLEKDDNLRLALEVRRQLEAQGIPVLMTRDTDVYVTLQDRATIANDAGADLFVSLHRNSYTEQTPSTMGVENFIYLTAPEETAGRAAGLVLDEVVDVGVQSDRGVSRGNYYVLRRTRMPAMLLEMGFIINDIDNQLFDEHLVDYAAAIAKGIMSYFGLAYQNIPGVTPGVPGTPELWSDVVGQIQQDINNRFGLDMPITGMIDATTMVGMVQALQIALNNDLGVNIAVDGIAGPATMNAVPNMGIGSRGNIVYLLQSLLLLAGYDPGTPDGIFGPRTSSAVRMFQQDHYLTPDGIAGPQTMLALLT